MPTPPKYLRRLAFTLTLLCLAFPAATPATTTKSTNSPAHQLPRFCKTHPPTLRSITVKHRRATLHQRRMILRILRAARHHHAPRVIHIAAIAATTQEASARNLPYGHGSSVGLFQLIDLHGTIAWRLVPENSAGWFIRGALKIYRYNPRIDPASLAQAVERSAYPTAYQQWVTEARHTYWTVKAWRQCHPLPHHR